MIKDKILNLIEVIESNIIVTFSEIGVTDSVLLANIKKLKKEINKLK